MRSDNECGWCGYSFSDDEWVEHQMERPFWCKPGLPLDEDGDPAVSAADWEVWHMARTEMRLVADAEAFLRLNAGEPRNLEPGEPV